MELYEVHPPAPASGGEALPVVWEMGSEASAPLSALRQGGAALRGRYEAWKHYFKLQSPHLKRSALSPSGGGYRGRKLSNS